MSDFAGFSSRSTSTTIRQLPQRDEAAMSEFHPEPGFSNSSSDDDATTETEAKVVPDAKVEDKAVKSPRATKK